MKTGSLDKEVAAVGTHILYIQNESACRSRRKGSAFSDSLHEKTVFIVAVCTGKQI